MARTLRCEMCGQTFECGYGPFCWCRSIKVPEEKLKLLSREASDCICANCLSARASSS